MQTPPLLPGELLEEIFLRLPPDEPEWLVRTSLASKTWLGLLSGSRFRGRYREFHGAPPMLGFLGRWTDLSRKEPDPRPRFVSTGKFRARFPHDKDWGLYGYDAWDFRHAWDCRHGRVLLANTRPGKNMGLDVWEPMTGRHMNLDAPKDYGSHGAAVLCAVTGCDHNACHNEPFRVIFVGMGVSDGGCVAYVHACLRQMGEWSKPSPNLDDWSKPCAHLHLVQHAFIQGRPPVLTEDALYFMLYSYDEEEDGIYDDDISILKYDLGSNCLSLIDAPLSIFSCDGDEVLMAMEDGSLGFARTDLLTLYLWSRQIMGYNGVVAWTACRVIDLGAFPSIQNPMIGLRLVGSMEGTDCIFVTTELGIYEINLKSLKWRKISNEKNVYALVPYMSFYDPLERTKPCDATN